ncbi:MAG: hypothetical protein KY445_15655 [Armatimonadetes bacterium]|nr:hypothetical protein [Armatimonadota bacterium]
MTGNVIPSNNTITGAYSAPLRFAGVPVSGVSGTYSNAATGQTLVNTATGVYYTNTSVTPGSPTWTVVGSQI